MSIPIYSLGNSFERLTMKRLLLSTTLMLGTLTGVKAAGATHPVIGTLLTEFDQTIPNQVHVQRDITTLKTASTLEDNDFFEQRAAIHSILKSFIQENPAVNLLHFGLTAVACAISYCWLLSGSEANTPRTMAPIAGALTVKTLEYTSQFVINYFETLRTFAHTCTYLTAATFCVFSYIALYSFNTPKDAPRVLAPFAGGLTLKTLSLS